MIESNYPLQEITIDAAVLDHAREFVELVSERAPTRYRELLKGGGFDELLRDTPRFNHGRLYVLAQFQVFQEEFLRRFPEAEEAACVNAFSDLFLKNDISISSLLAAVEDLPGAGSR